MSQKRWVFDPDSGGKKIPDAKKREVTQRINKFAAENYAGKYTRLDIRFRGQFCYIDAYTEPVVAEGWPPEDWPETREEMIEHLLTRPFIYVVCATLAAMSGALPFTRTAARIMN